MKRNVLVIEDEPIIGEMMSIMLEIEGYKVISLDDTSLARRKLHDKEVDMVMLDLNLRGKENGQSMCTYIKEHEELKHIPVILVSANADLENIMVECGANDMIAKPFDMNFFIDKVRTYSNNDSQSLSA